MAFWLPVATLPPLYRLRTPLDR